MVRTKDESKISASGEITTSNDVRVLSLARYTPTGPPLYPYQILSNYLKTVWELWPAQNFGFWGDNYITKTVRVAPFARNTPTGPPLHSY